MPSGYTSEIYDGDESFKNFVTRCAKDFGAYYHLRDEGIDAPLSKIDDWDVQYYTKSLDKSQTKYDEFTALSEDEQRVKWQEAMEQIRKANENGIKRDNELAERYGKMLAKVISWNVPDELKNLKDKMRKALEDSIDFDCGHRGYRIPEPGFEKWRDAQVDSLMRSIQYDQEHLELAKKRMAQQHAWHEMLMKAIEQFD
jgi:hypothetical protein